MIFPSPRNPRTIPWCTIDSCISQWGCERTFVVLSQPLSHSQMHNFAVFAVLIPPSRLRRDTSLLNPSVAAAPRHLPFKKGRHYGRLWVSAAPCGVPLSKRLPFPKGELAAKLTEGCLTHSMLCSQKPKTREIECIPSLLKIAAGLINGHRYKRFEAADIFRQPQKSKFF